MICKATRRVLWIMKTNKASHRQKFQDSILRLLVRKVIPAELHLNLSTRHFYGFLHNGK